MLKITENAELKALKNTIKNAKIEILNTYLIFVTDTTDGVCVKKIARCKFLQI